MGARSFPPLWITLPGAGPRRVDNAFEALEYLNDWPKRDRAWRQAIQACRDALDGFIPAMAARRALVGAVQAVEVATTNDPGQQVPVAAESRTSATTE
ncbi:DUF982 domain-containing protein [Aminobacter sp. SR38]|jgi:hypothetical protein|uniref:DUF982 domain-containing protein n=1 Tax=Aminobacter sp. SR38 TaxID=2774562 RepID=UPI00177CEA51|nr:DUF982 domain-containing protein [Aminobacter sp. SR38]QOF73620.1 DUF982 domain-containing protein [Aminobacter sp. SR38]